MNLGLWAAERCCVGEAALGWRDRVTSPWPHLFHEDALQTPLGLAVALGTLSVIRR